MKLNSSHLKSLRNAVLSRLSFIRSNSYISSGIGLLIGVVLFGVIGILVIPYHPVRMGSVPRDLAPSFEHPLGTDSLGRDLLAQVCFGSLMSLQVGFLAGIIGFVVALAVAFIGGYRGGNLDGGLTVLTEIFLTTPSLVILILLASIVRKVEILLMALIIAVFAWAWPAKTIRAQVLSLRERGFVYLARLSGLSSIEIIVKHMIPNILPFLGSYFAVVVNAATLSAVGLEVIGLGPRHTTTLGIIFYWAMMHSAVTRGLIWWWLPPCIMLFLLFLSLFLIQRGLDEIANPRLRGE